MRRLLLLAVVIGCNGKPTEEARTAQPASVQDASISTPPVAAAPPPVADASATAAVVRDQPAGEAAVGEGPATLLRLHTPPRSMAMDAPEPKTTITLVSKGTSGTLFEKAIEGDVRLIAFSKGTASYVLGLLSTMGAWRGMVGVMVLDEKGTLRDAKGLGEHFFALSSVPRADGDMIAFVSQTRSPATTDGFRLQVLDVAHDRLRDLGAAPAPPPLSAEMQSECKPGRGRGWGDEKLGGFYEDMDPNIITFADGKVRVTYGADTCKARAQKRTTKEWSLTTP